MLPFSYILKSDPFRKSLPAFALILKKFNPRQPRDEVGRFASSGSTGAASAVSLTAAQALRVGYADNTTVNEILSKFDNKTRYHLQHAEDRLKEDIQRGLVTSKLYKKDGEYTPERIKLHEEIVESFLKGKLSDGRTEGPFEKSDNPKVTFLGGRGGSGKSQFNSKDNKDMGVYDSRKTLVIDPDAVKAELGKHPPPKYEGYNAFLFHDESGHVSDLLIAAAKKKRLDMVLDITMKSDKVEEVRKFRKLGYTVDAHYMFLPAQMAAQRAVERFMTKNKDGSGRLVPPEVILQNVENEKNFDKLIGLVDNWSLYKNDVPLGQPPKRVAGKG